MIEILDADVAHHRKKKSSEQRKSLPWTIEARNKPGGYPFSDFVEWQVLQGYATELQRDMAFQQMQSNAVGTRLYELRLGAPPTSNGPR